MSVAARSARRTTAAPYRDQVSQTEPHVPRTRWARFLCLIGLHEGPLWVDYHCGGCNACGRDWIE